MRSTHHSVNQQYFQFICATSIGFSSLDTSACGQSIFNSQKLAIPSNPLSPTIAVALSSAISGQDPDATFGSDHRREPASQPGRLRPGRIRPRCAPAIGRLQPSTRTASGLPWFRSSWIPTTAPPRITPSGSRTSSPSRGLSPALTDEQEALLGCGPFYGTNCDIEGIDLMNIEASAPDSVLADLRGDLHQRAVHLADHGRDRRPARHHGLQRWPGLHALRGRQDLHPPRLPWAGRRRLQHQRRTAPPSG